MGSVRTLLALAVVFAHSYGFMFVGGQLAVQLFYIISGFLISYILVEAKTYQSVKSFLKNRFLRLYPIYWIFASLTFLYYFFSGIILDKSLGSISIIEQLDLIGGLSLIVSNILIIGQDWILFTAYNNEVFHLTSNFTETDVPVWEGLLVPQAWSLGVEISFYLLAPFILHNTRVIFTLLISSLLLRIYLFKIGLGMQDPWTYRFFPAELAFFLFGSLSHQILKPNYEKWNLVNARTSQIFSFFIFSFCFSFFILPHKIYFSIALFALFTLLLPFLFHFQSQKRWDRKIGELSYPIYVSHTLMINVIDAFLNKFNIEFKPLSSTIIVVITTIFVSFIINQAAEKFLEPIRSKVKEKNKLRIRN